MSNTSGNKLPIGWEIVTVRDFIEKPSITKNKLPQKKYQENGKLPVIDQGSKFIGGYTDRVDMKINCKLPVVIFGDHTKVIKYIDFDFVAGADGVKVMKPIGFNEKLFYYFLHSLQLPDKGYARHSQFLEKSLIPFPPLNEQKRIVSSLEELFTKLNAGLEYLKKTPILLKQYRQCVLKYAFEGKLTEKWRENNLSIIEDRSIFFEKLKNNALQILPNVDFDYQLPKDKSLPVGWVSIILKYLFRWANGEGLTKKGLQNGNYLVFGGNGIVGKHNQFLCENECLVIGRVGAQCGNVQIAPPKSWITDNAIYSKWINRFISIKYAYYLLNFLGLNKLSGGSGQPYVSQSILNPYSIILASFQEQTKIVEIIEYYLSIIERLEVLVTRNMNRVEYLRSSILKTALEGKLVPQDPNDEPASVLLEKIKQEKSVNIKKQNMSHTKIKNNKHSKQTRLPF